jgi:hypothetical protein
LPNILGFGGQHAAKVEPQLRLACLRIYNDAMAEMQTDSGSCVRLLGDPVQYCLSYVRELAAKMRSGISVGNAFNGIRGLDHQSTRGQAAR